MIDSTLTHLERDGERYGYAHTEDKFGVVSVFINLYSGTEQALEISPACARKLAAALLAHAEQAERDDQR